jgi:hypothetical protein
MVANLMWMLGLQLQPSRRLARRHPSRAFPPVKEPSAELTADTEVTLNLADPAGKPSGIGDRRPQVVDIGVEAVLYAYDTLVIC